MSDVVLFDTSVLVDEARTGRHRKRIESVEGLVRMSSVVLAELLRGVTGPAEHKFLRSLAKIHPLLTPRKENWLESGEILAKIRADQGFEPHKLRDLHFDVLIALTARSHGARLITTNRADFELISRYRKLKLEVW
ncbi:MAG: PIN domain-containing protein [Candidatus Sulfotelmatobacter sp.]